MSHTLRALAIALILGSAHGSSEAPAAERPTAPRVDEQDDVAAKIDQMIDLARAGRVMIRPQAAERLVGFGAPAAERLLEEAGDTQRQLASLGKDLIKILGRFDQPRLRAKLWGAIDDRDFPWRPSAAQGLGATAQADEIERFAELLNDPLAAVRQAAVLAYETLDARGHASQLRSLLADPNDRVRRAVASCLFDWGQADAIYWLAEELARSDRYFDLQTARLARVEAFAALHSRLGEDFGYRLDEPVDSDANVAARAGLGQALGALVDRRPELPAVARAGAETPGDRIGLELRSCRRGEFFLRWNENDRLYVGSGSAVEVALEPGTVAKLMARAAEQVDALGNDRFFGAPGCDLEQLHWQASDQERVTTIAISKGPETVTDLRPEPLTQLTRELIATLPDKPSEDPRIDRLRSRVVEALGVLGGPLER